MSVLEPEATTQITRWKRVYLGMEFAVLFLVVPVGLFVFRRTFGNMIIPSLVVLALGCTAFLLFDASFERRKLWHLPNWKNHLRRIGRSFLIWGSALALLVVLWQPELLLGFPRRNFSMWLFVMVFYPVFSVYPQEIIFRTFLFHRYRALLPTPRARIVASGVAFGLAHVFFNNWLAPVLTLFGGLLFARTYARSQSTLLASLEHGLWGDFIFTLGIGVYFYGGAIQ